MSLREPGPVKYSPKSITRGSDKGSLFREFFTLNQTPDSQPVANPTFSGPHHDQQLLYIVEGKAAWLPMIISDR